MKNSEIRNNVVAWLKGLSFDVFAELYLGFKPFGSYLQDAQKAHQILNQSTADEFMGISGRLAESDFIAAYKVANAA